MSNTTPLSTRIFEKPVARYGAALLAAAFALLARWALNPVLGDSLPYITLFPWMALILTNVMNCADVGVIQGGGCFRFALEAAQGL